MFCLILRICQVPNILRAADEGSEEGRRYGGGDAVSQCDGPEGREGVELRLCRLLTDPRSRANVAVQTLRAREAEHVRAEDGARTKEDATDAEGNPFYYVAFQGADPKSERTWPEVENAINAFKMAVLAGELFHIYPEQEEGLAPTYNMIQDAIVVLQE